MKFKWFRARLHFQEHKPVNPGFVVGVYRRTVDPELLTTSMNTSPSLEPTQRANTNPISTSFTEKFGNPNTYNSTSTYSKNNVENISDYVLPIKLNSKPEFSSNSTQLITFKTDTSTTNNQLMDDYLPPIPKSAIPYDDKNENWASFNNYINDNVFDDAISDFPTVRQNSYYGESDYINEITSTPNIEAQNQYLTLTTTTTDDDDQLYLPIKQSPSVIKKDIKRIKHRTRSKDSTSSYEEAVGTAAPSSSTKYQKHSTTKEPTNSVSFYERQDSIELEYSSTASSIFMRKGNRKLSSPKSTKVAAKKNSPRPQRNLMNIENNNLKTREIKLGSYDYDNISNSSQTSA